MKTIITIILLVSCSVANAHDEEYTLKDSFRDMAAMHNATQWGRVQNKIAAEAPPIRYDFTIRQAPAAPSGYIAPSVPNSGYTGSLQDLAKALAKEPIKLKDSPFNDSFMPGVE